MSSLRPWNTLPNALERAVFGTMTSSYYEMFLPSSALIYQ